MAYARRAYSYHNKRGKIVRVPARAGIKATQRSRSGTSLGRRPSVPAPTKARARTRRYKVDSPLRAMLPTPSRLVGKVSTRQGVRRLTQKGATTNYIKRQGRKQVRKVLPGTAIIKIRRGRRPRRRR